MTHEIYFIVEATNLDEQSIQTLRALMNVLGKVPRRNTIQQRIHSLNEAAYREALKRGDLKDVTVVCTTRLQIDLAAILSPGSLSHLPAKICILSAEDIPHRHNVVWLNSRVDVESLAIAIRR